MSHIHRLCGTATEEYITHLLHNAPTPVAHAVAVSAAQQHTDGKVALPSLCKALQGSAHASSTDAVMVRSAARA